MQCLGGQDMKKPALTEAKSLGFLIRLLNPVQPQPMPNGLLALPLHHR